MRGARGSGETASGGALEGKKSLQTPAKHDAASNEAGNEARASPRVAVRRTLRREAERAEMTAWEGSELSLDPWTFVKFKV